MNEPSHADLLIRKHLDGIATLAESKELEALLVSDAAVARRFAEVARFDSNLLSLLKGERDIAQTRQFFERAQTSHDEFEPIKPLPRPNWLSRQRWPVLAATILLCALGAIWWQARQALTIHQMNVAIASRQAESTEPGSSDVLSGQAYVDGKLAKNIPDGLPVKAGKKEAVLIKLADGSETELAPQATAIMHGSVPGLRQLVELLEGSASFKVEKGDAQFQVETPEGRVTVLGTEFNVELIKKKLVVAVTTGIVQVDAPGKRPVILVGPDRMEVVRDEGPQKKFNRDYRASFARVEDGKVFFTIKGGKELNFDINLDAEVWINGKRGQFSEIPKGTVVLLQRNDDKSPVHAIRAEGQVHAGEVLSVDLADKTITLAWPKGKEVNGIRQVVYRVEDNAIITIDGKPATIADLPVGMKLMVEKSLDGEAVVVITAGNKKVK